MVIDVIVERARSSVMVLGALCIGVPDFTLVWQSVPKGIAWHDTFVTLSGSFLLASGTALCIPNTARAASLMQSPVAPRRGPYEGLGRAWAAFIATLQAERTLDTAGLKSAGDFWETYLVGSESIGDVTEFQTELNLRLRKA